MSIANLTLQPDQHILYCHLVSPQTDLRGSNDSTWKLVIRPPAIMGMAQHYWNLVKTTLFPSETFHLTHPKPSIIVADFPEDLTHLVDDVNYIAIHFSKYNHVPNILHESQNLIGDCQDYEDRHDVFIKAVHQNMGDKGKQKAGSVVTRGTGFQTLTPTPGEPYVPAVNHSQSQLPIKYIGGQQLHYAGFIMNIGLGPDFVLLVASPGGSQASSSDLDYVSLEDLYDLNLGYWLHRYMDVHRWSNSSRHTLLTLLRAFKE
ncbi:hypothetical protein C8J56DRAFT_894346 [Mycena floridula]|nr:hypothetical protein C8J56DRAFT_894346 [Mycena floridula]